MIVSDFSISPWTFMFLVCLVACFAVTANLWLDISEERPVKNAAQSQKMIKDKSHFVVSSVVTFVMVMLFLISLL